MKILYGVQGTGNGHISRAREMARALASQGAEVDYLFSGRPADQYFDMEGFGDYQTRRGLTFVTEKGQLNQWKTLINNRPLALLKDIKQLDLSGYDLVLNDFEPVSAWAARRQNVHCIGLSHQNAFLKDVPKQKARWSDSLITRYFAPSSLALGVHWYHFDQMILPPIVPASQHKIGNDGSILVYLPFEQLELVLEMLTRFDQTKFYCFHPDARHDYEHENVSVHQLHREHFHQRMHQCNGVVANGGFELPSEAISLGKKLLLKPLHGQYEQQSNVMTLELMGLAQSMSYLSSSSLGRWLNSDAVGRVHIPDVAMAIAQWIMKGDWYHCDELWQALWSQVEFPETVEDAVLEIPPVRGNIRHKLLITGSY
ncbi:glycosyltransferase [Photobacterium sanctipauli]|uniref:Glycosyltransferase n=2 Tax=Photobacterium sanctipauli TaxID=1342794 RepID=A0A2T3NIP2_9GAMM|nr:MJ1255/VC2487 family glycosyltransferase [Photobacterium sanctipauli]PSW15121.1 glycosyltransferase [Photobacterium sanctipauli]